MIVAGSLAHGHCFAVRVHLKLADLSECVGALPPGRYKAWRYKSNNESLTNVPVIISCWILAYPLCRMNKDVPVSAMQNIEFMAPEQSSTLFEQTMATSFGIILFELLAGIVPFSLINQGEVARNAVCLRIWKLYHRMLFAQAE